MSIKGERSSSTLTVPLTGTIHKDLKIQVPDTYYRERSKLKHFMVQVDLFIGFNSTRFASDTKKVLWIVTLLRGLALNWVEGYV